MLSPQLNVPPQALALLEHDPDVAAWTGYDYNDAEIDGQTVPFLFQDYAVRPSDPVAPPILTGHGVQHQGPDRPRRRHHGRSCTSTSATPSW